MLFGLSKGISDNMYVLVCMGFAVGNFITKSQVYDFMLGRKLSITFSMVLIITLYLLIYEYSRAFNENLLRHKEFRLDSIMYLFTLSIFMGWPSGIIYTSSLYKTSGGRQKKYIQAGAEDHPNQLHESELETATNLILIMLDLGSLFAGLATALILTYKYPEFVNTIPS